MIRRYTCEVCGRAVEECVNQTLVRPDECGRCWFQRTGGRETKRERKMNMDTIVGDHASELREEETKAQRALAKLEALPVVTAEHVAIASELLQMVKGEWKRLEERRTDITKPILDSKRKVDDLFKPALEALARAEVVLKQKIGQAQMAIQEANRRAMEAAQTQLALGDARGAALATQHLQPTEAPAGVTFKDAWKWHIVNAAILPRDFLCPDVKKIEAHVKVHGDKMMIPGVSVEKDIAIAARSR